MKYTFSGHESFQCKSLWLKKGYDYVIGGRSFNDDYAVVALGVGKNMVASIRFWLKAFGILEDSNEITEIGRFILDSDTGADPYIEDVNTQWLLHYLLVSTQYATIYHLLFVDFFRSRHEFSKEQLLSYIRRLFVEKAFGNTPYNENTLKRDIQTLLKNYVRPQVTKNFDDFSAVLLDLNLIKMNYDRYVINPAGKVKLHPLNFLYALRDQYPTEKVLEYQKLLEVANVTNPSESQKTTMFMSVLFAIAEVTAAKRETGYPLIFDAPTSSFGEMKESEFYEIINKIEKQCIIVTKDMLVYNPETKTSNIKAEAMKLSCPIYRIAKKDGFNPNDLSTIQIVTTKIKD